jgi:RNA polymerase sigma factor (sigma-70 family)
VGASQRFIARYDVFFRYAINCSAPGARLVVDDLVQDVYVYFWCHDFRVLRQWKGEHLLHAYFRTVIARLMWRRLSRLQPRRELLADEPLTEASAQYEYSVLPATPGRWACAHEFAWIVCTTLEGLNPQDRHILELLYFHDLSYREIRYARRHHHQRRQQGRNCVVLRWNRPEP